MSNEPLQTPAGAGGPSSADAVHAALRFLRVVQRRRLHLVSCLVACSLLGALYYFTAPRIYEAKAGLRIQRNIVIRPPREGPPHPGETPADEVLIMKSREIAKAAIEILERLGRRALVDFEGLPRAKWVDHLLRGLEAREIRRTNHIEISYKSKSAFSAGAVLNAIIKAYTDYTERHNQLGRKRSVEDVDEELTNVESQLKEKEKELEDLTKRIQYTGLDENGIDVSTGHELKTELEQDAKAQKEFNLWDRRLREVRDGIRRGTDFRREPSIVEGILGPHETKRVLDLDSSSAETRALLERRLFELRAELANARTTKGEGHGEVLRLQENIRRVESYLRDPLATLDPCWLQDRLLNKPIDEFQNAEYDKRQAFDELEKAMKMAQKKSRELEELERIDREIRWLDRGRESLLDARDNHMKNIDRSPIKVDLPNPVTVSDRPVCPRLSVVGMLCLLAGLGIGMAVIYVQDVLDDRFRSPEELQEQLGVPLLAVIRQLAVEAASGLEALLVHVAPSSAESEGFRTWRAALQFSGRDTACIALSSSEEKAGKTTLAGNFGVSYAHAGKHTLLIDCDLRALGLTRLFEVRGRGGLSDIVSFRQTCAGHEIARTGGITGSAGHVREARQERRRSGSHAPINRCGG